MTHEQRKICEYRYWDVYLHECQSYLGRVYVLLKDDRFQDFLAIDHEVREEFFSIGNDLKKALQNLFQPDKMNYAALGNVFEKVHVHIIPRYKTSRLFGGVNFIDTRWGQNYAPYDKEFKISDETFGLLQKTLKSQLESVTK